MEEGGAGSGGKVDTGPGQTGCVQLTVISKQSPRQQCAVIFSGPDALLSLREIVLSCWGTMHSIYQEWI